MTFQSIIGVSACFRKASFNVTGQGKGVKIDKTAIRAETSYIWEIEGRKQGPVGDGLTTDREACPFDTGGSGGKSRT